MQETTTQEGIQETVDMLKQWLRSGAMSIAQLQALNFNPEAIAQAAQSVAASSSSALLTSENLESFKGNGKDDDDFSSSWELRNLSPQAMVENREGVFNPKNVETSSSACSSSLADEFFSTVAPEWEIVSSSPQAMVENREDTFNPRGAETSSSACSSSLADEFFSTVAPEWEIVSSSPQAMVENREDTFNPRGAETSSSACSSDLEFFSNAALQGELNLECASPSSWEIISPSYSPAEKPEPPLIFSQTLHEKLDNISNKSELDETHEKPIAETRNSNNF